jgi:predicted PurR-regulated permease PerM
VPLERRQHLDFVEETVVRVAGGYLRGQLVMALTIGVLAGVGALLFGLRYPVVIGVVAGVLELVPMVGPVLGALPALLLALVLHPFPTVLWVGLYFLAIQQLESNVLGPRITGHAVGLHPIGALLALLGGFELAGVLGGLFAVPVVGVLWVLGSALYRRVRFGEAAPAPARPRWGIPRRRGGRAGDPRPGPAPAASPTPGAGRDAA